MSTPGVQLGVCLAAHSPLGLRRALEVTTDLGDLWLDVPTDTPLGLIDPRRCLRDRDYLDEVATALGGARVGCVSNSRDAQLLLGPHGRHTDPVATGTPARKREHAVACALGSIRLAERVGAPAVRLLVGCPDFAYWLSWPGDTGGWDHNVAEFFTHAEPIMAAARDSGLRILLEPHPRQIVYDRISSASVLYNAHPDAGLIDLCVDPANLAAMGHDPVAAVTGWGRRMYSVHAKDLQRSGHVVQPPGNGWSRYGPQPPIRFRSLGCGELDWPAIVAALLDEGFAGVVYVEHEDVLLPREQSLARSLALLGSLLPAGTPEGRTW
ncbi:sugar phosphate isomerase/epimerase family protein [Micromonospora sp. SD19]|uniref:sugar phosphate isomerase/epimerase family protein n=1 Tax=Micromonospora parva TaxID=1464048 RepID=UPI00366EA298